MDWCKQQEHAVNEEATHSKVLWQLIPPLALTLALALTLTLALALTLTLALALALPDLPPLGAVPSSPISQN